MIYRVPVYDTVVKNYSGAQSLWEVSLLAPYEQYVEADENCDIGETSTG